MTEVQKQMSISRDAAFGLLKKYVTNERTIAHCLASNVVLRALAIRNGCDENQWALPACCMTLILNSLIVI